MRAHDWGYVHRPNPGQTLLRFPRGRVVGGSSAVNTCIALRGQPYDYDEWGALGLPEWTFARCLPAFKRLEDDRDFDNASHGEHEHEHRDPRLADQCRGPRVRGLGRDVRHHVLRDRRGRGRERPDRFDDEHRVVRL